MAGSGTSATWSGWPRGRADTAAWRWTVEPQTWMLAVLIIAALSAGFFLLAATPNSDPQKIGTLRLHMAGGMLILVLTIIRFVVRMRTAGPADAMTGYPFLDSDE